MITVRLYSLLLRPWLTDGAMEWFEEWNLLGDRGVNRCINANVPIWSLYL